MTDTPPARRKYETRRRGFESRLDPKYLRVDQTEWIQPDPAPAPITLPALSDHGISDASIGLAPDSDAQIHAERYVAAQSRKRLYGEADARCAARRAA